MEPSATIEETNLMNEDLTQVYDNEDFVITGEPEMNIKEQVMELKKGLVNSNIRINELVHQVKVCSKKSSGIEQF